MRSAQDRGYKAVTRKVAREEASLRKEGRWEGRKIVNVRPKKTTMSAKDEW